MKVRASKLSEHFDAYEIFSVRETKKIFEARDGQIQGVEFRHEKGHAVRGMKEGKLFFSYTFEDGQVGEEAILKNLRLLFPYLEEDRDYRFPEASPTYPALALVDRTGLALSDEKKAEIVHKMEGIILSFDRRIVKTRSCTLSESYLEVEIENSSGLTLRGEKTVYTISAMAVAKEKDEVSFYDYSSSLRLSDLDYETFALEVAQKTVSFLGSERINTGVYDGVIRPRAMADLLRILSFSFLSENLFKRKTRLKERGERYFFRGLNIVDSGLRGIGAFPFDGEGVASRETHLVKEGFLLNFLFDSYYGGKFGVPSTGNAIRDSLREPPRCGARGMFIQEGEGIVGEGRIVIEALMGVHTANPVTGDFSVGADGFILDGQGKVPFRGVIFAGNVFELLNNIQGIGKDTKAYGRFSSPSVAFSGLKIAGV